MFQFEQAVREAAVALNAGGVIAYPTEYCFGLGPCTISTWRVPRVLEVGSKPSINKMR